MRDYYYYNVTKWACAVAWDLGQIFADPGGAVARTAWRDARTGVWDRRGAGPRRASSPDSADRPRLRRRSFPCCGLGFRGTGRTGRDRQQRAEEVASAR